MLDPDEFEGADDPLPQATQPKKPRTAGATPTAESEAPQSTKVSALFKAALSSAGFAEFRASEAEALVGFPLGDVWCCWCDCIRAQLLHGISQEPKTSRRMVSGTLLPPSSVG